MIQPYFLRPADETTALFIFQDQQAQNDIEEMLKSYESYRWHTDPMEQLECILLSEFWTFVGSGSRPNGFKPFADIQYLKILRQCHHDSSTRFSSILKLFFEKRTKQVNQPMLLKQCSWKQTYSVMMKLVVKLECFYFSTDNQKRNLCLCILCSIVVSNILNKCLLLKPISRWGKISVASLFLSIHSKSLVLLASLKF